MAEPSIHLPPDEVMRQMAKLAIEQATEFFAQMADQFAASPSLSQASGREALTAFANVIRNTNADAFPKPAVPS